MTLRQVTWGVALILLVVAVAVFWNRRDNGDHRLEVARVALDNGDSGKAEELVQSVLRDRPDDLSAQYLLVQTLRKRSRYAEAEAALSRAVRLGLPEAEGRREFALILSMQDWPPEAEGILRRAAREHANDPEVILAVAGAFVSKAKWVDAGLLYDQLLLLKPDQMDWRFRRGMIRMRAANFGPAVVDFRQVLAADPSNYEARLYLAHSLLGEAKLGAAEQELSICRRERPDHVEPLVGLAKCAVERNDLAAAEDLLKRAEALDPGSVMVLQEQATLDMRRQRYDEAIVVLRRLVRMDPSNKQAHLNLAQSLVAAGKPDEARKHELIYQELDRREADQLLMHRGLQ